MDLKTMNTPRRHGQDAAAGFHPTGPRGRSHVALADGMFARAARAEAKRGGKLRIGIGAGSTTDSLDPATYTNAFMGDVGEGFIGATLTRIDQKNLVQPASRREFRAVRRRQEMGVQAQQRLELPRRPQPHRQGCRRDLRVSSQREGEIGGPLDPCQYCLDDGRRCADRRLHARTAAMPISRSLPPTIICRSSPPRMAAGSNGRRATWRAPSSSRTSSLASACVPSDSPIIMSRGFPISMKSSYCRSSMSARAPTPSSLAKSTIWTASICAPSTC